MLVPLYTYCNCEQPWNATTAASMGNLVQDKAWYAMIHSESIQAQSIRTGPSPIIVLHEVKGGLNYLIDRGI